MRSNRRRSQLAEAPPRSPTWWRWGIIILLSPPVFILCFGGGFVGGIVGGLARPVEFDGQRSQPPLTSELYRRSRTIPLVHRAFASLAAIAGQPIANPRAAELRAIERELTDLTARLESLETALQITPETTEPDLLQRRINTVAARLYDADPTLPTAETISLPADLLFTNETVLDPTQRSLFDPLIERLTEFPEAVVYVASHTDHQGDREAERAFSFDRAAQILAYLRGQIDDAGYRWMAIGYGSTRPIVIGEDAIDRQSNRRIELKIYAEAPNPQPPQE